MRRFYWLFLICLLTGAAAPACHAQKQLVLLKNQKVRLRLYPGDEIVYRLKGSKTVHTSYINNLFDTAVMIHQEIVPFHKIDRIYFKQRNLLNLAGGFLVTGAVAYFLIDQVNETLVQGNDANLDKGVARTSLIMTAVGVPLLLLHRNSRRIGGRIHLLTVDKGSAFYHPDIRNIQWVPN
ncbi:hypothetical protein [Dawidia soli]|uniref:Uncharacterized protein n=1 Tax=Dawidia soli TaxID=2782352 RepID=A0AAP2GJV3_9BACT|nr:hypothetical protein [Dawidia soli]MBT1688373.1 hypothetical protein [Dawidia soli]